MTRCYARNIFAPAHSGFAEEFESLEAELATTDWEAVPRHKMAITDGTLIPDYECYCGGDRCDEAVLGLGRYRDLAAKELREHHGWRTRWGKWFCPKCYTPTQQERQATRNQRRIES